MAGFQKMCPVWLAIGIEVEAATQDEAIASAVRYLKDCLAEQAAAPICFHGEVLPMDQAVVAALQLLSLERRGGDAARRGFELREEIALLSRQASQPEAE